MPLNTTSDNAPSHFPTPQYLTLGNFERGVITLIDKSHLPKNAAEEMTNLWLVEDGEPSPRPGVDWYGTIPALPTPGAPTVVKATGSTLGVGVYKYVVTFVNAQGETNAGTEASVTTSSGTTNVTISAIPTGPGGTTARKIYRTSVGGATGTEKLLHTIADNTTTTYTDSTADGSLGAAVPTSNTAQMGAIQGFDYFDDLGDIHIVMVLDGNVIRSTDDAQTWTLCSGATLTSGTVVNMEQYNAFVYITNGIDPITRYDGTTTLQTYTTLSAPVAPTTAETGMTGTDYTFYYEISAVSDIGFTEASPAGSIQTNEPRANWVPGSKYVTLTLPSPVATQTRLDIYFSVDNLNFYYLDSVPTSSGSPVLTYVDDGTAFPISSTTAPIDNTTTGPTVATLKTVSAAGGGRMFGVGDPNNRNRIWFTSGAQPLGSFSSGYDGGYLDWELGGKYLPIQVADYRDGKGTPMATVFCNSADGQGTIIQMSLNPLSIGSSGLSVTIPSAYKLPGSRGTPAPRSVVNVLDDYFFYNTQALYQLGSNPQLLQILSTQELSANIRPNVQSVNNSAASGIASAYYYDRVYFSVPQGSSTTNNNTMIFDTARKAWLPTAYDIGFAQFLHYTDTAGNIHLLAFKAGDNQITELGTLFGNDIIQGDYGQPFATNFLSGLYQTEKDRFGFQYVQEMQFEFSNPQGTINVELLGIEHSAGFGSQVIVPFNAESISTVNNGWDTFGWDLEAWDFIGITPTVVSESSSKRYAVANLELNAVQWHISTSSLNAAYILRTLQTWGTDSEDAPPSDWLLESV